VTNPVVQWLLSHSYGQGGAVAVPSEGPVQGSALRGEFPPGIQDVLNFVTGRYGDPNHQSKEIDWVFLIGGPGNGKSEAMRDLAHKLDIQLPPRLKGQPVPRALPQEWPQAQHVLPSGLEITFVNDASIPRPDALQIGPNSLFLDVKDCLTRIVKTSNSLALFANVNRGILVEEADAILAFSPTNPIEELAKLAIQWLASPHVTTPTSMLSGARLTIAVPTKPVSPYYGQIKLELPNTLCPRIVVIHVVFLDTLSLLEPAPGAVRCVDLSVGPPHVAEYRTLGTLVSNETPRDNTTAGKLVGRLVESTNWQSGSCRDAQTGELCAAHSRCPFAQNARWLQDQTLRNRYLDTMRAAEIAAGRRFTYRDLLGHLSLTLLGQPEDQWLGGTHPCQWSAQQVQSLNAGSKSKVVALALHRIYSSLFTVTEGLTSRRFEDAVADTTYKALKDRFGRRAESPRLRAFERAFHDIDPARDTNSWDGLRVRAMDAVEALDIRSPFAAPMGQGLPAAATSEIELVLDQVLREELAQEHQSGTRVGSKRGRFLRRWRAIELLRHIGLANGHVNNGHAIQVWLSEHENALRNGERMILGDGIYHLVLPRGDSTQAFLAPLRPRTHAITGDLPNKSVLVPLGLSDLSLVITAYGDAMLAEVQVSRNRERLPPVVLAILAVDLAIAREAILHADGNMRPFTEIGYTAFARIERARASLVSRRRARTLHLHFSDDHERLLRIASTPGSLAPLRVQVTSMRVL
jgi:hypothetical protein